MNRENVCGYVLSVFLTKEENHNVWNCRLYGNNGDSADTY